MTGVLLDDIVALMKVTVSIPDNLWAEANPDDSSGPSDTVQRALRVFADQLRAPDQSNLKRYQQMFNEAVETTAKSVGAVLDNGYRFGLLVAPGLTPADFETIDGRQARKRIQEVVLSAWGEWGESDFSTEFEHHVGWLLDSYNSDKDRDLRDLLRAVLGDEDTMPGTGVVWAPVPGGGEGLFPRLSDTFADGALAGLRDVRDEATRRMTADGAKDREGN